MTSREGGTTQDDLTVVPGPAAAMVAVSVGDLLAGGRYRIVSKAQSGGMGAVAEAVDTLLDRRVAVKFLKGFSGPQARDTIIREARAMAALRHRSICRVLEVVIDAPVGTPHGAWRPFIVMEWVDGAPLSASWASMRFEKRLAIFEQVVEAVAALHAVGLVHRDLKPSNILLDGEGVPVIVDFGISARSGTDDTFGGTLGWSAPEQFDRSGTVGPAADVFSLGVLFFNMLTGALPFEGSSSTDVLRRAREGDAPLPDSIVPGLSPPLQRISLAAIDPDPAQRYADAAALLADIRRFRAGETVLARPRRLYTRFADELESHLADTERWRRQGLATDDEVRAIRDGLQALQRPESPWILDSRRLSPSQVVMYVGAWMLVLALTVGVWNTRDVWRQHGEPLPWVVPVSLAFCVTLAGVVLSRLGEQRAALGFLFTSTIAVPAAAWHFLRDTHVLEAARGGGDLVPQKSIGLSNDQQLVLAGLGLVLALLWRRRTPSSAFTCVAVAFGVWLAFAWGLRTFDVDATQRDLFGQMARWMLMPAAILVVLGVACDARSNRPVVGLLEATGPRDGGPALVGGLLVAVLSLTALSAYAPEWFWFRPLASDEDGVTSAATVTMRASAFLASGVILLAISLGLGVRATPLRGWCSRTLRWIVPSFLLIPIAWLEIEGASPGWGFWLLALAAVSIALVSASSILQWRPFLLSGLLGLLDVFVRSFMRIDSEFGGSPSGQIMLMLGAAAVGIASMVIAAYPERWLRLIAARKSPPAS